MTDHIPDATKKVLSLAAQAVLKSVQATLPDYMLTDKTAGFFAAAALRALADQVVPVWKTPPSGEYELEYGQWIAQNRIRVAILAIATELEAL